jgi:hypothetical protein
MKYIKYIVIGLLMGIFFSCIHVLNCDSITFSELILKIAFSEYVLTPNNASYFDKVSLCLFPLIIFQVIGGMEIYRHYCIASVYYFSRCVNRIKWYFKEIYCLLLYDLVYLLSYILGHTILSSFFYDIKYDLPSIKLMLYFLIIYTLWNFIFSLLINIAALFVRSNGGFAFSIGIQMFFVSLHIAFQEKLYLIHDNDSTAELLIKLIPFSHLMLSWHSSRDKAINEYINIYNIPFDLNYSVICLLVPSILIVVIGALIIKKIDFICSNKETGG